MAALSVSKPPTERWEVAKTWRDGGTPILPASSTADRGVADAEHGDGAPRTDTCSGCFEEDVVRVALLRTCFSEHYGLHIPRMFHDLLVGLGETFPAAAAAAAQAEDDAATGTCTKDSQVEEDNASAVGGDWLAETGRRNLSPSPPVFHVTEYDVTKGQYPESWEKFAGYILPGGVASACGGEPWMTTLLTEAKGLRESGRPVLAFCLGHQVMAQALGGLVRPRAGPRKHYALQESELLVEPAGSSPCAGVVSAAVETVRREKEGGGGGRGRVGGQGDRGLPPRMRLLYHHNDEVVKLPPGATNISTSRHCQIHGMMMDTSTAGEGEEPPRPNLLTFQAHPELNYEYGRRVMDGILDADVKAGRLTHEKARRLKEQVSAWDHKEFPLALELMRRLFQPIVRRQNGGLK